MAFLGLVVCRIGTVSRPAPNASWRSIGVFTNPLLLWGVAFEIAVVTLPPPQSPFHTAVPDPSALALLTREVDALG